MKRIYTSSVIALLTLAFVFTVQAQSNIDRDESTTDSAPSPAMRRGVEETNTNAMERKENLREEMQERREDFEDRVADIKDSRRQALVEKIDEKVNDLNERHTDKLQNALERMQTVLDSIETKAASVEADGGDIDDLEIDIETAQEAIDDATASVEAQIDQVYVMDVSDEDGIRTSAQEVFALFREDIEATHMSVKDAHMAVITAARSLAQASSTVQEEDEEVTVTPTADEEDVTVDEGI